MPEPTQQWVGERIKVQSKGDMVKLMYYIESHYFLQAGIGDTLFTDAIRMH